MAKRVESAWKKRADRLEFSLRQGRQGEVREALMELEPEKVPQPQRAPLANLAWRTDLPQVGARLLYPRVRGALAPTAAELSEYAACIVRLGVVGEAEALLKKVSPGKYPRSLLYLAFAQAFQWNYEGAVASLEAFLAANEEAHQRTVTLLNLAAAHLHLGNYGDALGALDEILIIAPRSQHVIRSSAAHLYASVLFLEGHGERAKKFLSQGEKRVSARVDPGDFVVRKWQTIAAVRHSVEERTLDALENVRDEARVAKLYESVRECDRVAALATGDRDLCFYLYFGTPHLEFRSRLLRDFGPVELPDLFLWQEGDEPPMDPLGLWGEDPLVKPGSLAYGALGALVEDFYAARTGASLGASLFRTQFYQPDVTEARVAEGIRELRVALIDSDADVTESDGYYRLMLRGESFIVPRPREDRPAVPLELLTFMGEWGDKGFTADDLAQNLEASRSAAMELIKQARKLGGVEPMKGRRKAFRFKAPSVQPHPPKGI